MDAGLPANWIFSGDSQQLTTTLAHTGNAAVQMNASLKPQFGAAEAIPGGPAIDLDMGVDTAGIIHSVYNLGNSINYSSRSTAGVWSIPISLTDAGHDSSIAVSPSGEVHVVWMGLSDEVFYRYMSADGTWAAPTLIAAGGRMPKIALDHHNHRPHVVYLYNNQLGTADTDYISQLAGGAWSSPQMIWRSIWVAAAVLPPQLSFTSDDQPQIVAADSDYVEFCQPTSVAVNCDRLLIPPYYMAFLTDEHDTSHILSWSPSWNANSGYYGRKLKDSVFEFGTVLDYSGGGDLAVDSVDTVYVANRALGATVTVRYKTTNGSWSVPDTVATVAKGNLKLVSDQSDKLHLVYETPSLTYYQPSLTPMTMSISTIAQVITIPGGMRLPTLSLLYSLENNNQVHPSEFDVLVGQGLSSTLVFSTTQDGADWAHLWLDLSPWTGQTFTLTLAVKNTYYPSSAQLRLDEISLGSWLTPVPQSITPSHITAPTQVITITGDNFFATPQVRVNDTPLPDVTWINTTTLTATVPALPSGRYDLIVTNPGGQASGLPRALLVGYEVMLPIVRK